MYAARHSGPGIINYVDIPLSELREGEALVRVKSAGLCGSDMHRYNSSTFPNLATDIYGHEISGVVERLFSESEEFKIGDSVVINPILRCRQCIPCKKGSYQFCESGGSIGKTVQGGFAEYLSVPISNLYKFDSYVPYAVAALADPLAVSLHSIHKISEIKHNDNVAIIGDGTIGILTAYLALKSGYSNVKLIGKHHKNLDVAEKFGIDVIYLEKGSSEIMDRYDLRNKIDIVLETVGGSQSNTLQMAADMAVVQGEIIFAGVFPSGFSAGYNLRDHGWKELSIKGSNSFQIHEGVDEFESAVEIIKKEHSYLENIITHSFPLSKINDAIDIMNNKNEHGVIKVILSPGDA